MQKYGEESRISVPHPYISLIRLLCDRFWKADLVPLPRFHSHCVEMSALSHYANLFEKCVQFFKFEALTNLLASIN